MKQYPHQQFIENNNLDLQSLPTMLRKRIIGFDELEEDLQYTTDEDKEKLLIRLEGLSNELEEDLEEHFEDHLENNDAEEEEEEEPTAEIVPETVIEEPEPEPEFEPIPEPLPEPEPDPEPDPEPELPEPEPEPIHEPTDEEILEGFILKDQFRVFPIELMTKGFKTPLTSRVISIGTYSLHRGKYDNFYKILKIKS